jgi:hypothetical protein
LNRHIYIANSFTSISLSFLCEIKRSLSIFFRCRTNVCNWKIYRFLNKLKNKFQMTQNITLFMRIISILSELDCNFLTHCVQPQRVQCWPILHSLPSVVYRESKCWSGRYEQVQSDNSLRKKVMNFMCIFSHNLNSLVVAEKRGKFFCNNAQLTRRNELELTRRKANFIKYKSELVMFLFLSLCIR